MNFNEDGNNPLFYISNPYCYIRNFSSNDCVILASVTNSNISNVDNSDKNIEDGTVLIVGKEIRRLKLNSSNKVYLTSGNGAAVAEICTSDSPISPWNI